jgi:hypothetical protein
LNAIRVNPKIMPSKIMKNISSSRPRFNVSTDSGRKK